MGDVMSHGTYIRIGSFWERFSLIFRRKTGVLISRDMVEAWRHSGKKEVETYI